jgi:hypothetical protein
VKTEKDWEDYFYPNEESLQWEEDVMINVK